MSDLNIAPQTLMQGDNLDFLRAINSECIDLIATDPPFNKGRDFHATPDSLTAGASFHDRWSWERDVEGEWVDELHDDWPAAWAVIDWSRMTYGDDMGAFLCYMGVRILEMHRILKPSGSLWLHCDDTAAAYLKTLLDAIFGRRNFRAQVTWKRYGSHNDAGVFGRITDTLLYYSKDAKKAAHNTVFVDLDDEYVEKNYTLDDEDGRGRYMTGPLHASKGHSGGGYAYEFRGYTRTWRYPEDGMRKLERDGRIRQGRGGKGVPRRKIYLAENQGKPVANLWDDIGVLQGNDDENTGYPTQKPVELYARIIRASSNEGDVVLDPFCGCATTLIAAQQLDRRWLGMDHWDKALDVVRERLEQECPMFTGKVGYINAPPERSDDGEFAAPPLRSKKKTRMPTPAGEAMPREQMVGRLYDQQNGKCAGCDIALPQRYFDLDHKLPRSDGGHNGISNRALLCGPCNRRKSNTLTLSGLRKANKKDGWIG